MGPGPRPVERRVRGQDVSPTVTVRDMPFPHTQGTSGDIGILPLVTHWLRLLFLAQMLVAALNSRKSPALRSGPGSAATLLSLSPPSVCFPLCAVKDQEPALHAELFSLTGVPPLSWTGVSFCTERACR